MMDLERVREAIEVVASGGPTLDLTDLKALRVVVHFAIDVMDLLANGERVEWCEEHRAIDVGFHVVEGVCTVAAGFRREQSAAMGRIVTEPTPCRIVSRLLIPPTEEE